MPGLGGISIDTVYQMVLAIANKEQRGYISPQEFNLYANMAQLEIFEQYFYDLYQFRDQKNDDTVHTDMIDILEEKLQIFENVFGTGAIAGLAGAGQGGVNKRLPDNVYRIHRIELNNKTCEILNTNDFNAARYGGPLVQPSNDRPIANVRNNIIRVVGSGNTFQTPTGIFYTRVPNKVSWGYVVVNQKALYDPNPTKTVNFEFHRSEKIELVYKILKLAGVGMKRQDVVQSAQLLEVSKVQQEKV